MSSDHYDPSCDLSVQDIVVNSITNLNTLQVHIEGPTWVGTHVTISKTEFQSRPRGYTWRRGIQTRPIFRKRWVSFHSASAGSPVKGNLDCHRVECSRYSGHSFRIGGGDNSSGEGCRRLWDTVPGEMLLLMVCPDAPNWKGSNRGTAGGLTSPTVFILVGIKDRT